MNTSESLKVSTAPELKKALKTGKRVVDEDNTEVIFRLRQPAKGKKTAFYQFEIPARIAGTRVRKQAETPSELLSILETELDKIGSVTATRKEKTEFEMHLEELRKLRARGISIKDLITHYIGTAIPKDKRRKLSQVQEELMELKAKRNPAKETVRGNLRHGRRIIADFNDCYLDEVELGEAYEWVMSAKSLAGSNKGEPWNGKTRQHNWNWLNELLDYGVSEGYVSQNPLRQLYKAKLAALCAKEDKAPEILPPAQADEYLHVVWEKKPELLPLVVLNLFAGIRFHESMRLKWKDLKLKKKQVHVSAKIAKMRRARFVELNELALEWLDVCLELHKNSKSESEYLGCYSEDSIEDRFEYLRKYHLSFDWPQNAPRHSYASHALVLKGEEYTKKQLGHSYTSDQLFKHYRAAVTDEQAEEYFNIRPRLSMMGNSKVVPFSKAS